MKNVPQSPCMTCACQKQCAKNISVDPHYEKCSSVTIRSLWPRTVSFAHLFDPQGPKDELNKSLGDTLDSMVWGGCQTVSSSFAATTILESTTHSTEIHEGVGEAFLCQSFPVNQFKVSGDGYE